MQPAGERPTLPAGERPMLIARIDTVSIYPVPGNTQDSAVSLMLSVGKRGIPEYGPGLAPGSRFAGPNIHGLQDPFTLMVWLMLPES